MAPGPRPLALNPQSPAAPGNRDRSSRSPGGPPARREAPASPTATFTRVPIPSPERGQSSCQRGGSLSHLQCSSDGAGSGAPDAGSARFPQWGGGIQSPSLNGAVTTTTMHPTAELQLRLCRVLSQTVITTRFTKFTGSRGRCHYLSFTGVETKVQRG